MSERRRRAQLANARITAIPSLVGNGRRRKIGPLQLADSPIDRAGAGAHNASDRSLGRGALLMFLALAPQPESNPEWASSFFYG